MTVMKKIFLVVMSAFVLLGLGSVSAGADIAVNIRGQEREAIRCVRSLPKTDRDAWLAQLAGLLFCQDGSSVHTGKIGSEKVTIKRGRKVEHHRNTFKEVRLSAVFVGSDGKLYNYRTLCDNHKGGERTVRKWKEAGYYTNLVGPKPILDAFADEIAELRRQKEAYMKAHPEK